jgi:DNA-binding Xre family transcriptional regulator
MNGGKNKKVLTYKINVLETLKESGYNSTRILKEGLISQSAMQKMRKNEMVGIKTIEKLCELLDMQPGNIIKYVEKNNRYNLQIKKQRFICGTLKNK